MATSPRIELRPGDTDPVVLMISRRQVEAFDIARSPNPHMAFGGGGSHFCLGASLARLEIRCMFEELLRRLPDIELDGPVQRLRSNFINGIKHMPVRFTPE